VTDIRRAVLFFAHYTGWSRAEIHDLPIDEFMEEVALIPTPQ